MDIKEFNKKDILRDFEYELNKLCRSCIGTATEIQIKQRPLISLFHQLIWFYEKEKEKNRKYTIHLTDKQYKDAIKLAKSVALYELEDKIKAKIEEYKKQIEKMEKDDIGKGFTLGKEWSDLKAKVEFGQSLLEKE